MISEESVVTIRAKWEVDVWRPGLEPYFEHRVTRLDWMLHIDSGCRSGFGRTG
jgi:hypothetical protein